MSIASYITLQTSIGHLLSLLKKPQIKVPQQLRNAANFLYRDDEGLVTALDIRSKVPVNMLHIMVKSFEGGGKIDRFVMVTPYSPSQQDLDAFTKAFAGMFKKLEWLSVNDFAKSLGLKEGWDLTSPNFIEKLKAASVSEQVFGDEDIVEESTEQTVGGAEEKKGKPVPAQGKNKGDKAPAKKVAAKEKAKTGKAAVESTGAPETSPKAESEHQAPPAKTNKKPAKPAKKQPPAGPSQAERINKLLDSFDKGEVEIPHAYVNLTRKMPYPTLRALKDSQQPPEEFFGIGQPSRDSIIVLSDIVNFSLLVRTAYAEDLNQAMFRYYRGAQALIYEHGGILDKFNGDAVLAVFNYPLKDDRNCALALKYAAALVQLGQDVLSELTGSIDEKIPTGTRVGIAMGEMWTLNIGTDEIDVTFVGDKINLAKRLESNCDVDGVLLSNVFAKTLARADQELYSSLKAQGRELPEDKVKGQTTDIISWQVLPEVISSLG